MSTTKPSEAATTETQKPQVEGAQASDAPKVRARRLSTSVRAGQPSTDGGDGTYVPPSDTGDSPDGKPPIDGNYATYGAMSTWSCR